MHLGVRPLHILLELLLLLFVEYLADLVVRLGAKWPYPGKTLLT